MNLKVVKLSMINRFLLLLTIIIWDNSVLAQPNFLQDTIYLPGAKLKKISSIGLTDIWIIGGNNNRNVYRLFEKNIADLSSAFQSITDKQFSDIRTLGTNNVIVGTLGDYLYHYNNGSFSHIDMNYGLVGNNISVITEALYNSKIQTDQGIYSTVDFKNFIKYKGKTNSETLISRGKYSIIKFYDSGELRLGMEDGSALYSAIVPTGISYNNLLSAEPFYYNSGYISGHYFGTSNGLYYRNFSYSAQSHYFLSNHIVYVIITYNQDYKLIGTNNGLYIISSYQDPVKINLDGKKREIYDLALHNGCIYACSDSGLLRISDTNCTLFKAGFNQDKTIINLNNNSPVNFIQTCSNCPKKTYWNFGDFTFSNLDNPTHIYSQTGNMQVSLQSSNKSCNSEITGEVVVFYDTLAYMNNFLLNTKFTLLGNQKYRESDRIIIKDFNNDNLPDIMLNAYLLINNGSDLYEKHTTIGGWTLAGDFNNDGLIDVLGDNGISGVYFFQNTGNLVFKSIKTSIPFLNKICLTADYDNDGFLDVLVVHGSLTKLYKNNKGLSFAVDERTTFGSFSNPSFATWTDINNDNYLDLYILSEDKNSVFINNHGIFSEISIPELAAINNSSYPASASWGDFNNDGKFDILQTTVQNNKLFKNNGMNSFSEMTEGSIVSDKHISRTYSSCWTEINNDGNIDLITISENYRENRCFVNNGNNVFYNDTSNIFTKTYNDWSKAIITEDMDLDGDMDIIEVIGHNYSTNNPPKSLFFENKGNNYKWLRIKCIGTKSNYEAIGAKVRIKAKIGQNYIWQTKLINCYAGIHAQESGILHFGFGNATIADSLIVYWPLGDTSVYTNLTLNKDISIIEPCIRVIGDTITCENEFPKLVMPSVPNINYKWYYNNIVIDSITSNELIAKRQGYYKVEVNSTDLGKIVTKHTNITFMPVTKAKIEFEDKTSFCFGDSVKLITNYYENVKYQWYKYNQPSLSPIDLSQSIYAKDDSSIYCIYINQFQCKDTSKLLSPTVFSLPKIYLREDTSICIGDSVLLTADFDNNTYQWNTNETSKEIYAKNNGKYKVTVTDSNACINSDSITIKLLPLPDVFLGNNRTISYFDILRLQLPLYHKNYLWHDSLDSWFRDVSGTIDGLGSHLYTVTVTGYNGCKNSDSITINIQFKPDLDSLQKPKIFIFPNPAFNNISIYTNLDNFTGTTKVEFFDATGRFVFSTMHELSGESINNINISILKPGLYYVRISNKLNKEIFKLLVY